MKNKSKYKNQEKYSCTTFTVDKTGKNQKTKSANAAEDIFKYQNNKTLNVCENHTAKRRKTQSKKQTNQEKKQM